MYNVRALPVCWHTPRYLFLCFRNSTAKYLPNFIQIRLYTFILRINILIYRFDFSTIVPLACPAKTTAALWTLPLIIFHNRITLTNPDLPYQTRQTKKPLQAASAHKGAGHGSTSWFRFSPVTRATSAFLTRGGSGLVFPHSRHKELSASAPLSAIPENGTGSFMAFCLCM